MISALLVLLRSSYHRLKPLVYVRHALVQNFDKAGTAASEPIVEGLLFAVRTDESGAFRRICLGRRESSLELLLIAQQSILIGIVLHIPVSRSVYRTRSGQYRWLKQ